jgi:multimeric flavodoxin WrbA
MKILAICGSPRKGNTYSVLKSIQEECPDIYFKLLELSKMNFEFCKGCYVCVKKGEDKCPVKDDRDQIIREMMEADGIILASPVYSHMVSAPMKNFFDRFGFYAHRPQFFEKFALSIATCSGYGGEYAIEYMEKMLSVFGFNIVPSLELQFRPGKMPEKNKEQNHVKTLKAVNTLLERIERGEKDKPKMGMMVPFHIFKYISTIDKDVMSADYEYYKDKNEYYYEASIPFVKKFLAKRVANKIIAEFD